MLIAIITQSSIPSTTKGSGIWNIIFKFFIKIIADKKKIRRYLHTWYFTENEILLHQMKAKINSYSLPKCYTVCRQRKRYWFVSLPIFPSVFGDLQFYYNHGLRQKGALTQHLRSISVYSRKVAGYLHHQLFKR
jgi:sporulation-control protein spo0M